MPRARTGGSSVIRVYVPGAGGFVAERVDVDEAFLAVAFLAARFLTVRVVVDFGGEAFLVAFFAARLAGAFFVAGARAARSRSSSTACSSVTGLGVGAAWHRGVDGAVGDVGPEAAVEHADRCAGLGVRAELGERRLRRAAAPLLRLGEDRLRLAPSSP